jgi:uncharacterized protein (DUF342 family)
MDENVIYSDEYVRIFVSSSDVYVETFQKGFSIERLSTFFLEHPEISITNFTELKNSICSAPMQPKKFGELKERIIINISNDALTATITFNLSKKELEIKNRENLIKEALSKLNETGVVFGINKEILLGEIISGKPYVIANGIPPVNGTDSIIKMYKFEEVKPKIHKDGRADFYDLKLINRVKVGDWLGERIEATEGVPGRSVKGEVISPVKGKTLPLNYDKNTVQEILDNSKTILYARVNGAVHYSNGRISVSNHLEIDGDVNPSTGNVKFDGYLSIKGTVADGFSVEATRDIEINGELGLGNIKEIVSTNGSIYISGGISSKDRAIIRAAKNVFIKFVDNADITCGGRAHIGYYCINSTINARDIALDSPNGKIIGGHIKAEIKVSAPIIGSEIEKKTLIEVTGFNRKSVMDELNNILKKIGELKTQQQKLKQILSRFEEQGRLTSAHHNEYTRLIEEFINVKEEIRILEEERKNISVYLRARGDGEISASKKIFPNCTLILKNIIIEISTPVLSPSYFIQDGEIRQV